MYTLKQFKEITKHLPGDFELRIEAQFAPEGNGSAPCFEIVTSRQSKQVILLPQVVHISDGETGLTVRHEERGTESGDKKNI